MDKRLKITEYITVKWSKQATAEEFSFSVMKIINPVLFIS